MIDRRCEISVIIATVGRSRQLRASLESYEKLVPETPVFEVVVVLDGDDPDSRSVCAERRSFPITTLSQKRAGNGPAKNRGVEASTGDLVVFLNDDTRPAPDCLAAHVESQRRFGPCVGLGRVDWDPETEITPYMSWLAPAGHQFNFSRLDPEKPLPWDAAWGAHLAMPRKIAVEYPFTRNFPYPSLEDIDWGWRLEQAGVPMRYVPEAVSYHDHLYRGPADYRSRARISGAAARWVGLRHPALVWPLIVRPSLAATARLFTMLWPGAWRRHLLWDLDFRCNYVLGMLQPRRRDRLD